MIPLDAWQRPGSVPWLVRSFVAHRFPEQIRALDPLLVRCSLIDLEVLMAAIPFAQRAGEVEGLLRARLEAPEGDILPASMRARLDPDELAWASARDAGALMIQWLEQEYRTNPQGVLLFRARN